MRSTTRRRWISASILEVLEQRRLLSVSIVDTPDLTITSPAPNAGNRIGEIIVPWNGNLLVGTQGTEKVFLFDSNTGAVIRTYDNPGSANTGFGSSLAV